MWFRPFLHLATLPVAEYNLLRLHVLLAQTGQALAHVFQGRAILAHEAMGGRARDVVELE